MYLRARYYDPALGRFLGRDPFTGVATSPQSLNRYLYVLNNPVLLIDPYGYWGLPSWDDVKDKAGDLGGAIVDTAGDIGGSIQAGAQWLGEDYHWLTVAEVGGTVAFIAGVSIVTGGTATPLMLGVGGVLIAGGLGVGATATAADIALRTKACREGDTLSCVEVGISVVTAPFGYLPGCRNALIGAIGPATSIIGDIASSVRRSGRPEGQQSLVCTPSKE